METALTYRDIQPPFATLRFREMSQRDLKEYSRWFHEVAPQRIAELAEAVKQSVGYEHWFPNYTPDSLDGLSRWLATQVSTRSKTEDESRESVERLPHPEYESNQQLTDRSISLAFDIGMFLSEVLLRNHPSLKWGQLFGSRKSIDYGQPVLLGFRGKVPFNPVRMLTTLEYGLTRGSKTGNELREIYDIWSAMVE